METQPTKQDRQTCLISIIDEHNLTNHEEVRKLLHDTHGIHVVQSTISKDFEELKIEKSNSGYYILGKEHRTKKNTAFLHELMYEHIVDVKRFTKLQIGIESHYDMANTLGLFLKSRFKKEIMGYLSEKNFLMIYCREENNAQQVWKFIRRYKKKKA